MRPDYDVVIAGGGWVGGLLALALRQAGVRFAVVEPRPLAGAEAARAVAGELRTLVVAPSSRRILTALGLWEGLQPTPHPIERIHCSDRGHWGFTRMAAADLEWDALGHVVLGQALEGLFQPALAALPAGCLWAGWRVCSLAVLGTGARIGLIGPEGQKEELSTALVVGADGAHSTVRDLAGIATRDRDYGQSAIVARVAPQRPHENTAYERFTSTGPLALVPVDARHCGAIWAVPRGEVDPTLALEEAEFARRLTARSGGRLGALRLVGPRRAYPLFFSRARAITAPRLMLAGNAAHTIHPNAAQGLNLGARDAAWIAEIVADALARGADPGGDQALRRYALAREGEHNRVIAFSDGLARLFYNDFPPAVAVRGLAMVATDLLPPVKRALMRRAMGLHGRQPRLVRGIGLAPPAIAAFPALPCVPSGLP